MNSELQGMSPSAYAPYVRMLSTPMTIKPAVEIKSINGVAFHYASKDKDNQTFVATLDEIDSLLRSHTDKLTTANSEEGQAQAFYTAAAQLLSMDPADEPDMEKVPEAYRDYLDVFSKAASDVLPPNRSYDHKIQLKGKKTLGHSPLYKMSHDELETLRKYGSTI